jgi:hypothetical protein
MKTPEEIESLARGIRLEPDAPADERILSAAEAALDQRKRDPAGIGRERIAPEGGGATGRRIMRNPIVKLGVAAVVIVGATLLAIHFFGTTSGIAWAAVLAKVNSFDTCVYRSREVETTGPRPDGFEFATESESRNYRSETCGAFSENYKNGELYMRHYTMLAEKQHLSFAGYGDGHKVCMRMAFTDKSERDFRDGDPRQRIAKILAGDYVETGEDTIEGKRVRGVELRDPNVLAHEGEQMPPMDDFSSRFWIDVQTGLPVWMEISYVPRGSAVRTTRIWDQFEWGVSLEASLFKPEIPGDYEVWDDDGKTPDSTPKTDAAEAFARQTLAEPYLGDFDHLPLPDVSGLTLLDVDTSVPRPQVRLLGSDEIRLAQDACVAKWPPYEQVQAQLRQELRTQLDIDAKDVNGLATTGIALRNRFWELGGTLSDVAYPYVYAARLVDEIAHEKAPDNPAVTDQLVESIMAYEVMYYWQHPRTEPLQRNPIYRGLLSDLRREQFEQFKARVAQGCVPTWKDFVRCSDFALLWSRRDPEAALEAIRLLIDQAPKAGWTFYLEDLRHAEQRLLDGEPGSVTTFLGGHQGEYLDQYSRRLWSFQGPQEFRENCVPMHLRRLKGW